MKLEISRCPNTGLLYVNEVPFTRERIIMVKSVMEYANENHEQFQHMLTISDTGHEGELHTVVIDKFNFKDFMLGVSKYDLSSISSDEDWNNENHFSIFSQKINPINNINWSELRNQKRILLDVINADGRLPDEEPKYDLRELLDVIDNLQKYATDILNIPSIHIYDFGDEEGKNDGDFKFDKNRKPMECGDVLIPVENDFEIDDKSVEVQFLNNCDWTPDEKTLIKSLINNFGTGQHPVCDEKTFQYFRMSYLKEILTSKKFHEKENSFFTPQGYAILKQIKNKLGIV